MASSAACVSKRITRPLLGFNARDPLMQCLAPSLSRAMATEASTQTAYPHPEPLLRPEMMTNNLILPLRRPPPPVPNVLTTIYDFPSMEPLRFEEYSSNHLSVPLRRDILHRAVIFEGDSERQGTASTKWRADVHGSNRKIRKQKGLGMARLGDKKSPMLRGGGVAFGPKPRDFSTRLPKKVYDLAWRIALSYRYGRGELIVVEDGVELEIGEPRWFQKIMEGNRMGNEFGRSLIVTKGMRPNLWQAVSGAGRHGKVKTENEVDVKNMLELGRIIMEKSVLDSLLAEHSSDLDRTVATAVL